MDIYIENLATSQVSQWPNGNAIGKQSKYLKFKFHLSLFVFTEFLSDSKRSIVTNTSVAACAV
jgi:hypothetical protein